MMIVAIIGTMMIIMMTTVIIDDDVDEEDLDNEEDDDKDGNDDEEDGVEGQVQALGLLCNVHCIVQPLVEVHQPLIDNLQTLISILPIIVNKPRNSLQLIRQQDHYNGKEFLQQKPPKKVRCKRLFKTCPC